MKKERKVLVLWYCVTTGCYQYFETNINPNEEDEFVWIKVGTKK